MADMPQAVIDENGISVPDYAAIWTWLAAEFRRIYGEDIYIEADSQDGQLIAVFAHALTTTFAFAAATYHAFSPLTASGRHLSTLVGLNGLIRRPALNSTCQVDVFGDVGTVIAAGSVSDKLGQLWSLEDNVIIPASGEISVLAVAVQPGPLRADPGSIIYIEAEVAGWDSVYNTLAAVPGREAETDAELRARQRLSTMYPATSLRESLLAAVLALENVSRVRVVENTTGTTDADGIPGHSIGVIVEGGDNDEIAETIAAKKALGVGTAGEVTRVVTDEFGTALTINFFRLVAVPITVEMTITPVTETSYTVVIGRAIQDEIAAYINTLDIGEEVRASRLYAAALLATSATATPAMRGAYTIDSIELVRDSDPAAAEVEIAFNEVAFCTYDLVDLTVTVL